MAKVNGPLFSLDASGKLGNAIVYSKWKGRNVVREYVVPANPRSIAQRARRSMIKLLNLIWGAMSSTDKDSWTDLAIAGNYSTFNGFTSYNLDQQTTNDEPTKNRSDTPGTVTTAVDTFNAAPGVNRIDFVIEPDAVVAGEYAVVTLAEGASAPGLDLLKMVQTSVVSGTTFELPLTDVPAGQYTASCFIVNSTGGVPSAAVSTSPFTVTGV